MPEWLKVIIGVAILTITPTIPAIYYEHLWIIGRNHHRSQTTAEKRNAQSNQGVPAPSGPPIKPSPTKSYPVGSNATDQSQDSEMKITDWLLVVVGFLQFGAIIGQLCIYRTQARIMRISLDATRRAANAARDGTNVAARTLTASHRAWIKAEITMSGQPCTFSSNGINVNFRFMLRNVGNAPALHVSTNAWLVPFSSGTAPTEELRTGQGPFPVQIQRQRCEEIRRHPFDVTAFTLFPQERFPDIDQTVERHYGIGLSKSEIGPGLYGEQNQFVSLHVVGCVDYTFPSDITTHHQSRFSYRLMKKPSQFRVRIEEGRIDTSAFHILVDEGQIAAESLQLIRDEMGWQAD